MSDEDRLARRGREPEPTDWVRDGMVSLCPKCRSVKEGSITWALSHQRECGWAPAPVVEPLDHVEAAPATKRERLRRGQDPRRVSHATCRDFKERWQDGSLRMRAMGLTMGEAFLLLYEKPLDEDPELAQADGAAAWQIILDRWST